MREALNLILKAKESNSSYLDLSGLGLKDLPKEVEELNLLTNLDLSCNSFSYLPSTINKLYNLKYLNLNNNVFSYSSNIGFEFPSRLSITKIDISRNNLTQIPDDIFYLKELEELDLSENPLLKEIPEDIKQYGFHAIYDFIKEIQFSRTTYILLESKMIFVGQGEVGKTSLVRKITDNNYFFVEGYEPTTHGINIKTWKIPIEFTEYELKEYFNIINYDELYNEFYEDFTYDDEEDNEDNDNDDDINYNENYEDEYKSEYMENIHRIEKRDFSNNRKSNKDDYWANLNIWDFGGQEIYYSTHQFFLTKRSIYIFVWDARKEEEYRGFEYWFNTINILSEKCPILIVMNKSDQRTREIDEANLKKNFPNIFGFYRTSCKSGEGINLLRQDISLVFKLLPHVGDKLPRVWVDIRTELSNQHVNFISYELYLNICFKYKIYKDRANFLSSYLHDLGDILHFQKDEILNKIVILNPEWVTNAFYRLIDSKIVQHNKGNFSLYDLQYIWSEKIYPKEIHLEIIRLIESFEICFNIVGSKNYIIPELLSNVGTFEGSRLKDGHEIKFEYRFKFMPAGIIARFICRNFLSIDKGHYWKSGLAVRYEDAVALIESDIFERKIRIVINGDDKISLLGIVRREFNYILLSLNLHPDKDFFEMLPCVCKECRIDPEPYFFEYGVLRKFQQKRKVSIPCQKTTDDVLISDLVNGYNKIKQSERILDNLIIACSQLQGYHKNLSKLEDSRNSFVANVLSNRGLVAKDQTRWGSSPTDIMQGEIDIKIESSSGTILGIFEGFNLSYADKNKIHKHLEKIFNYDPNGLDNNYVVVYCDSQNFTSLWKKYQEIALTADYKNKLVENFVDLSSNYLCGANIRIGRTAFDNNEIINSVYHIFVNMFY